MNIDSSALSPEAAELVRAELTAGERVIWVGQPNPPLVNARSLPIFIFTLLQMGGLIFSVTLFWPKHVPAGESVFNHGLSLLFLLPGFAVTAFLLSYPFSMRRKLRSTVYLLTARRLVIFEKGRGEYSVRSIEGEQLKGMRRSQKADGSGDLVFEGDFSTTVGGAETSTAPSLLGIPNVKQVEEMIRQVAEQHPAELPIQ